ncbi:MAG: ATP-binding cassette domain-containing protein [Chitinophagaceae bacterium]
MKLRTSGLVPVPLKDRLSARQSDIWSQSLELEKGRYLSVLAPSGTGKTTLIQSLYGIRRDYEGDIFWGDQNLRTVTEEELAHLRSTQVSIIFQDMRLFPDCTAWENLEIKRSLTNTASPEQVSEWMLQLGIADKKNAPAAQMSYGEQQRLSIIRALLQPFSFLLMDEPFSHLDKRNTRIASGLILSVVQQRNAALLLADLDENDFFPYHQTLQL